MSIIAAAAGQSTIIEVDLQIDVMSGAELKQIVVWSVVANRGLSVALIDMHWALSILIYSPHLPCHCRVCAFHSPLITTNSLIQMYFSMERRN